MSKHSKLKKALFIPLGFICVILGLVGIVLPILPTTPFLLLAAFLFYRSSEKLHDRLLNSKLLGDYISSYIEHRAIKRKIKIMTITILWSTLIISAVLINNWVIWIALATVGSAVTFHILRLRTLEKIKSSD